MDLLEENSKVNINNWYYYSKFKLSLKMLTDLPAWPPNGDGESVLVDVGAGSGVFIKAFFASFTSRGKRAYAVDKFYEEKDLGMRDNIIYCRELPENTKPFYFFFMDILEHVDNDIDFLKKWVDLAPQGSTFLITVPAFTWLWSSHDLFLKHKKRYSLKELETVITSAGLDVLKSNYFYASIFPFAILQRKIIDPFFNKAGIATKQGIKPTNKFTNFILKTILNFEIILCRLNRLFGLSCILIAQKKDGRTVSP